uniref:Uncharacterized protein n=1 Tax=Cacopsylla melanoneura TaxID=428564 RepID=A0A8D8RUX4_9HEMI
MVEVRAIWLIDYLSRSGIQCVVSNIIIHECDNLLLGKSLSTKYLIHVAYIGLMSVSDPSFGSCYKNCPSWDCRAIENMTAKQKQCTQDNPHGRGFEKIGKFRKLEKKLREI